MIVTISRRAREDLRKIFRSLAFEAGRSRALKMIDRVEARCQTLENMPERGPSIGPKHSGLRYLIELPYLIVYKVTDDRVRIVTVLHGRRDIESELRDLAIGPPS